PSHAESAAELWLFHALRLRHLHQRLVGRLAPHTGEQWVDFEKWPLRVALLVSALRPTERRSCVRAVGMHGSDVVGAVVGELALELAEGVLGKHRAVRSRQRTPWLNGGSRAPGVRRAPSCPRSPQRRWPCQ